MDTKASIYIPACFRAFQGFSVKDIKEFISSQEMELILDRDPRSNCDVQLLRRTSRHVSFKSCSRKGNSYDNAWTESFMKTLKYDELYMREYETMLDEVEKLPNFIEEVYNKKKLYSAIGYLPPEEFETIFQTQTGASPLSFQL